MASFQITDRPETTSPLNDDNFLMQNSGTGETKRVTFGNLTGPFVAQIEEKIFEVGNIEKRQTVLYGSIDSNGYANFLTGNGAATLTLDATPTPVVVTWASGDANYKATISADLTLDISGYGNGTYYAYLDYNSGTPTLGAVSLVPTDGYGAASTNNNQHHFRIPEMKMYVGNGSTAAETLRVFVGEFKVSSGTISEVPVTYALRGEYESEWFTMNLSSVYLKTSAIGSTQFKWRGLIKGTGSTNLGAIMEMNDGSSDYSSNRQDGVGLRHDQCTTKLTVIGTSSYAITYTRMPATPSGKSYYFDGGGAYPCEGKIFVSRSY